MLKNLSTWQLILLFIVDLLYDALIILKILGVISVSWGIILIPVWLVLLFITIYPLYLYLNKKFLELFSKWYFGGDDDEV